MLPIVAMRVAAACGPIPGMDVRIFPSRECSTICTISLSNCSKCLPSRFNSAISCCCSNTRLWTRAGSFVPILWAARRCNSSSLASETLQVRPRASRRSSKLASASSAGVGKRERRASAVGRLGLRKRRVNEGYEFITDRGEFVFALRTLCDEFIVMAHHSTQRCGGLGWRDKPADCLQRITHLDAFLQLVIQQIGQTQGVALVRFEQTLLPLLDMDDINRNIEFLQVLQQSSMIVPGDF